jgi:hypothetical protein
VRIGYIILAHTLPDQLVRLVRRLGSDRALFLVHVDARAPDEYMEIVRRELGAQANVELLPRRRVQWCGFSLVEAALSGIHRLLRAEDPPDYGVLLTGQDYPICTPAEIEDRLATAAGYSFLTHRPSQGRFLRRMTRAHWHGTLGSRKVRFPNRLMPLSFPRRIPAGLEPWDGSAHWCLSRECLEYVVTRESRTIDFFRWVACPEESFFQSILMSSPLAPTLVNDDLRYVDWSEGGASPRVLTVFDLDRMLASDALFARKFDPRVDPDVIDLLDARAQGQGGQRPIQVG